MSLKTLTDHSFIAPGQRLLLKISGEFLQGNLTHGICWDTLDKLCQDLALLSDYQWVIMVGGGNFFRGQQGVTYCGQGLADTMGMISTHCNGLALFAGLSRAHKEVCLMTARGVDGVGESFSVIKAEKALLGGSILICTGGAGHGAMTTDTAAVIRACELNCPWILKGTSVKGVYDRDPKKDPLASFYPKISYEDALFKNLGIVDMTALTLAKTYAKNMVIFSLRDSAGLKGLMAQEMDFSLIHCG